MSLPTVLALFDATHGAATLKLAALAGKALSAPIDALLVNPDPREAIPMIGEAVSGDLVSQVMDNAEAANAERAKNAKAVFEAADLGSTATYKAVAGNAETIIAREGRVRALTMLSCDHATGDRSGAIGAALFETGRPILIAPHNPVESLGKRIAIFWKESPEAAKAVWAAIPFLRQADQVKVFSVGDDAPTKASLERIGAGLKRATIAAETVLINPKGADDSQKLIDAANDMNADMIVMGAYSHSRLQEFIFGGVTRDVLDGLARPVFMAH